VRNAGRKWRLRIGSHSKEVLPQTSSSVRWFCCEIAIGEDGDLRESHSHVDETAGRGGKPGGGAPATRRGRWERKLRMRHGPQRVGKSMSPTAAAHMSEMRD
jgi:hypothetical protein